MNFKYSTLFITLIFYCFFNNVNSQPCGQPLGFQTFTYESLQNITATEYSPCASNVILSNKFDISGFSRSLMYAFNYEPSSNSIIALSADFDTGYFYLLSCGFQTSGCDILGSIYFNNSNYRFINPYFLLNNKVVYFAAQDIYNPMNFYTAFLDYNTGLSGLIKLNALQINSVNFRSFFPIQTLDTISNKMYVAYSAVGSNNQPQINILEFSTSSPLTSQTVYKNIQNVNDFKMLFTDDNNQLYLLHSTNNSNIKDEGWVSVCRVDLINLDCSNIFSQNIGIGGAPFTQYTISNDGQYLIFETYYNNNYQSSELILTYVDINNGFSFNQYTIDNRWSDVFTFTWFLF